MSTDQSTELIWHFIGYLHMEELLSKLPIYYSGATQLSDEDEIFEPFVFDSRLPKSSDFAFEKVKKVEFSDDIIPFLPTTELPRIENVPLARTTPELIELSREQAPQSFPKTTPAIPVPDPEINFVIRVNYVFGGDQHHFIEIDQRNFMSNNDLLLSGANEGITDEHDIDAEAVLGEMLEDAREVFSDLEFNPLEQKPEEIAAILRDDAREIWSAAEAEWEEYVEETGDTETPMPYPGTVLQGTYIDGELVEPDDTEPAEASDDTPTSDDDTGEVVNDDGPLDAPPDAPLDATSDDDGVVEVANDGSDLDNADVDDGIEGDEGFYPGEVTETETGVEAQGQEVHITTAANEPTGGNAQIATTGGNEATNSALISDFSDGYGSIIVMGDVYATNAIYQVNVLHDNDAIEFDDDAELDFANSGNNSAENKADFQFDTQTLIGNPAFGNLPVGFNWNVDYIDGNYYDIKVVTQLNDLIDNDVNEQSTTNTHFTASLGDNSQTDIAQIFDAGKDYDLIIIEGDVYELNIIAQINLLLDDDAVSLNANGEWDATQSADTGGNQLLNDAVIINVGGGEYQEMTDNAEELADAIGDMETEIDPLLASDLPGNGSNDIDVLYITGDFYDLKAIYQLNIMSDVDLSEQSMADDTQGGLVDPESDDSDPADFEQSVETGQNTETNSAVIVDVDSTSDYQYLDGDYYQNDVLVQANIIEEDELEFDTQEGLLETTIALLEDHDLDTDDLNISGDDLPDNVPDDDVLGNLLG